MIVPVAPLNKPKGTQRFVAGALLVALSKVKSAGNNTSPPDFAWYSSVLVNEDRLCR
jgi:hypothetical protein